MLNSQQLHQLAEAHIRAHEQRISTHGVSVRLQVMKLCDLEHPPGAYYGVHVAEPASGLLLGGGGFFVSSHDGRIREFGSGEMVAACRSLYPEREPMQSAEITPTVVRFLLEHSSEPFMAPSPKRWWQLWK